MEPLRRFAGDKKPGPAAEEEFKEALRGLNKIWYGIIKYGEAVSLNKASPSNAGRRQQPWTMGH